MLNKVRHDCAKSAGPKQIKRVSSTQPGITQNDVDIGLILKGIELEWKGIELEWKGIELEWKGIELKWKGMN